MKKNKTTKFLFLLNDVEDNRIFQNAVSNSFIINKTEFVKKNGLLKSYNIRLPAFLAERFTSYWFTQNLNIKYLSHARIGEVMLSNNLNRFFNIIKFPLTFRMYPTLYKY